MKGMEWGEEWLGEKACIVRNKDAPEQERRRENDSTRSRTVQAVTSRLHP